MRRLSVLVPFLVLLAALTAVGGPATARTTSTPHVTLTAHDGWLGTDHCRDGEGGGGFRIHVDEGQVAGFDHWDGGVKITGPGLFVSHYAESSTYGDQDTFEPYILCFSAPSYATVKPGTYTIHANVMIYLTDGTSSEEKLATTFTVVGPAHSSMRIKKVPYHAHGWVVGARLTTGGRPWAHQRLQVDAYYCGAWRHVLSAGKTDARGVGGIVANRKRSFNDKRYCGVRGSRLRYRFRVDDATRTYGTTSRSFHLSYRR